MTLKKYRKGLTVTKKERTQMRTELREMLYNHGTDGACRLIEVWVMQHKYSVKEMVLTLLSLDRERSAELKKKGRG